MSKDPDPATRANAYSDNRCPVGIKALDGTLAGGLPRGRITLIEGEPGAGKTIFGIQFLVHGATECDEPGVLVSFEETAAEISGDTAAFGWDLAMLQASKRIEIVEAILDVDVIRDGEFDLVGLLAIIASRAKAIGARRIVFDSIDTLTGLLGSQASERREISRLRQWGRDHGFTILLTGKAIPASAITQDISQTFLAYAADAWISLDHPIIEQFAVRSIRVKKMRAGPVFDGPLPFIIDEDGIYAAEQVSVDVKHGASTERVSSGITRLDTLLGGGFLRGSAILVSGVPGTAKTSLGVMFLAAACARGERCLLVSFDEAGEQIVRNARSIGVELGGEIEAGRLRLVSLRSGASGIEPLMIRILREMEDFAPACIVIDPLSAALRSPGRLHPVNPGQRVMDFSKSMGSTLLMTSLTDQNSQLDSVDTNSDVSTIADTWLHLSFSGRSGERNRAISILKSRGTQHSNQVRELVVSGDGIDLVDVYTSGGEVLMGTARLERESEIVRENSRLDRENSQKLSELEQSRSRLQAEIERTQTALRLQEAAMEDIQASVTERRDEENRRRDRVFKARSGDQTR